MYSMGFGVDWSKVDWSKVTGGSSIPSSGGAMMSKTEMRLQAEAKAKAEQQAGQLHACPTKHRLIQYYPGPSMPPRYLCAPEKDVKPIPKVNGTAKVPAGGTAVRAWAMIHGTYEVSGKWMGGVYVPTASLSTYQRAEKLTLTPVSLPSPGKVPPLKSVTPRLVDGVVQCPEGYYARTPNNALASCIPQGISSQALLPCPSGTKKVCKEVAEGVRCDCEPVEVIPMIGPGGEIVAEEVVAVTDKKKGLPVWAWGLIFGGGGLVVGGVIVGIIAARR
jgi:hypothetical protein